MPEQITRIRQIGSSLGVILGRRFLARLGLSEHDALKAKATGDSITLSPVEAAPDKPAATVAMSKLKGLN